MLRRKSRGENHLERVDRMGMSIFNVNDMESMHQSLNGEFMLYQLILKRLLNKNGELTMNQSGLFDYFQPDDENDQRTMMEFDRTYRSNQSIYWYTKESCIYRMLNKALRTQNIRHILAFGSLIRDLFLQLSSEQIRFVRKIEIPFLQVYRGQFISKDEVIRMKSSLGQLIAMNSFLSTSTNREQALTFAKSKSPPSDRLTSILLEITIYAGISLRPYADIKALSSFPKEEEILFMLASIFRIDNVFEDESLNIWRAKLTLCNDDDEDLKAFVIALEKDTKGKDQLVSLGHYLLQMQKFDDAQIHYETLLENHLINNDYDLATCHHGLAQVNMKKGDLNSALDNLQITLDYLLKMNETKDHFLVSQCYNDCASVYCKKNDYLQASNYYNKALMTKNNNSIITYSGLAEIEIHLGNYKLALEYQLKCLEETTNRNRSMLANIYCQMGKIFALMGEENQAKTMFEEAIQIQMKSLHCRHPDLGYTYNAIGLMYFDLHDDKQALKFFKKAIQIQLDSLPEHHSDFAETYRNFGNVYLKKNELNRALKYFNKSLKIQLKTLSSKHPSVCETYIYIGKVLFEENDYDQALEYFHRSLDNQLERKKTNDPTLVEIYELLATTYLKKADLNQSLIYLHKRLDNELERKVAEDLSLIDIYQRMAEIYCEEEHFQDALFYYYRIVDCQFQRRPFLESSLIDVYRTIGKIYLKKPFDQTFVRIDHQSIDGERSLLDLHNRINQIHFEKKHLDQLFEYFQQLFNEQSKRLSFNDPSFKEICIILGNIAMDKGDLQQAFIHFDKLIQHELQTKSVDHPSLANYYQAMGDISFELNQFDRTLSFYNRMFDCQSSIPTDLHSPLTKIFIKIGQIYLETSFEKLLQNSQQETTTIESTDEKSHCEVRHLHFVLKYFQERINNQTKDHFTSIDLLTILGNISFALNQFDLALKYFDRLLDKQILELKSDQHPSLGEIYRILAHLHYLKRHWDETLIFSHKFIDNELQRKIFYESSFIDIYSIMASSYYEKQNFDQSLLFYDRMIGSLLQKIPFDQIFLDETYRRVGQVYLKETFIQIWTRISHQTTKIDLKEKKHLTQLLNSFLKFIDHPSTQSNHFSSIELFKIIASIYLEKSDWDSTLIYLHKLFEEISTKESIRTSFIIDLYKILSIIYCEKNDFDQGLFFINRLFDCQHRRNSFDNQTLIDAYHLMGKIHFQHHHFHQSEDAIRKLYESSFHVRPSLKDIDKALQHVQQEKRHLDQTILYFQHLLDKQLETLPWNHSSVRNNYITMKNLFLHRGNIRDGIIRFEKLLQRQLQSHPLGDLCTANLYEILGQFYAQIENTSKSLEEYRLALSIYERFYPSTHSTIKKVKHQMRKYFPLNVL